MPGPIRSARMTGVVKDALKIEQRVRETPGGERVAVLEIDGQIGPSTVLQLEFASNQVLKGGIRHLILDCGRMSYMNSTGAVLLVKILDTFTDAEGTFQLTRVSKEFRDMLEILGFLDRVLKVRASVADAISHI